MTPKEKYRDTYWGHPYAQPVNSKEYKEERALVKKFVNTHQDKPVFQKFAGDFDKWLSNAERKRIGICIFERRYLWRAGVRGLDVLIEACSIWLFSIRHPHRIRSAAHRQYLIGYKVLRLPSRSIRTDGTQHRVIGRAATQYFEELIIVICKFIERSKKEHSSAVHDMAKPLRFE